MAGIAVEMLRSVRATLFPYFPAACVRSVLPWLTFMSPGYTTHWEMVTDKNPRRLCVADNRPIPPRDGSRRAPGDAVKDARWVRVDAELHR